MILPHVEHRPVWATAWHLGDGLWWRTPDGAVHAVVMTEEPTFGPRGGRKTPGQLTEINGGSLDDVNAALDVLGFEPTTLTYDEIKVIHESAPQASRPETGRRAKQQRGRTLESISASHKAALARRRAVR